MSVAPVHVVDCEADKPVDVEVSALLVDTFDLLERRAEQLRDGDRLDSEVARVVEARLAGCLRELEALQAPPPGV